MQIFCKIFCNLLFTILILLPISSLAITSKQVIDNNQPSFMSADYVEYNRQDQFIYARGNIEIILDNYFLTANSLIYDIKQDKLWAKGDVTVRDKLNRVILGETLILKDRLKTGVISEFILYFGEDSLLVSRLAKKINENQYYLNDSSFTPCKILCNQKPIWQLSANDTKIDFDENRMSYNHLFFEVFGIPLLYTPYFSHPTPKAPAKSGILAPYIRNSAIGIPLYYRAKPNLDFTLTPRITKKYSILELEARYKPNSNGNITLEANYGTVPYYKKVNNIILKNTKLPSYYILGQGSFANNGYLYGFRLEQVSDKAYLKNYYKNYASYLTSKIYLEQVTNYDYLSMEGMYLKGLGSDDTYSTYPLIFPKIRTKNVFHLNDDESSSLIVENNILVYKEKSGKELGRGALQLALDNNYLTSNGHFLHFAIRNRGDIYFVNHLYPNDHRANKVLTRNIPEIQNIWRYPLATKLTNNSSFMLEPIISATIGRKHNSNKKFAFIEPDRYELSENNLFSPNRYSGIDYHEFGNRFSYGINSAILSGQNYFNLFLGQSYNSEKIIDNIENVGKVSSSFSDKITLFYRFRKNKNLHPIRDELGGSFASEKFQLTAGLTQIANLQKYYFKKVITNNKVRQLYYILSYQLTENWSLGYDMRVDLPKKKLNILSKTIQVTYFKDCVRIAAKLSDDYVADSVRGIKKSSSSPTISVGLKILNM